MTSIAANAAKRNRVLQVFTNASTTANDKTGWQKFRESKPICNIISGAKQFGKFAENKIQDFGSDMKAGAKAFSANFAERHANRRAKKYIDKLMDMGYTLSPNEAITNVQSQLNKLKERHSVLINELSADKKSKFLHEAFNSQTVDSQQDVSVKNTDNNSTYDRSSTSPPGKNIMDNINTKLADSAKKGDKSNNVSAVKQTMNNIASSNIARFQDVLNKYKQKFDKNPNVQTCKDMMIDLINDMRSVCTDISGKINKSDKKSKQSQASSDFSVHAVDIGGQEIEAEMG